ncbi:carbonic anhydrase [Gordonia paraffinivorans]|uniref:Carbonic anhydrase n=1 Tax=Gordonia paraffinivorans NBRC 108238 TaxID=1223543 RepID=A0ABQ0IH86_9ACTN|nr:carbonic anhydrase [Gordonia paraffinivorans]MBY4575387.1 carbonic anhydrase [Gordonia paraffinivorans]MCD2145593.1 carbonic anhydrase [Gordonia paraffinivorans]PWD43353.1 carbonic anhydrase [Gordonia paraffinivorans]GAC82790.1 putative carbonic anhydrase [Gordonia paraffinivorans NBRC 108238]
MIGMTPRQAWRVLRDGNERFVTGESQHPSQGIEDRERLVGGQHPHVVLFGCADSRLAAEIIFDQGLGDMFVVRTAGHVIDSAVLGSLEYAVEVLEVPLIVLLGHDSCGAVKATLDALDELQIPGGYIRDVVERVAPSILAGRSEGLSRVDEFEARHVVETGRLLMQRSRIVADRIATGKLAIVGLTYKLSDGRVNLESVYGDIGEKPSASVRVQSA